MGLFIIYFKDLFPKETVVQRRCGLESNYQPEGKKITEVTFRRSLALLQSESSARSDEFKGIACQRLNK